MSDYVPEGALLLGGINLPTADDVFRLVCDTLADRLHSIPDGETATRIQWMIWQFLVLERANGLTRIPRPEYMYGPWDRFIVEKQADKIAIPELGYARDAIRSYQTFSHMKEAGQIPDHARFQVCLPPPLNVITIFVRPDCFEPVEEAYEAAMADEIEAIAAAIPAEELAIQWDACWEIGYLENVLPAPWPGAVLTGVTERLARLVALVPTDAEAGLHLCYGSYRNEHFLEPTDMRIMVGLANAVIDAAPRELDWLHMPVPRDRADSAYFEPLRELSLADQTRLYLGLVHLADGAPGAQARTAAASSVTDQPFGIGCECGLARVPSADIKEILELHAACSRPVGQPAQTPAQPARHHAEAYGAQLVGSLPLTSTEEVLRTVANVLPGHLRRITDGETGHRQNWIGGQYPLLMQAPELETVAPPEDHYGPPLAFQVRDSAPTVTLPELGYARDALASYEQFASLKTTRILRSDLRFQVSLPTPLALTLLAITPQSRPTFAQVYASKMLAELDRILGGIPHDQLCIQWDVCQEVGLWEGFYPPSDNTDGPTQVLDELASLARAVPAEVELGFHLCYGDYEHRHFSDPTDLGTLVDIANGLAASIQRPITYIHMPVPADRDDPDYFAPLATLKLAGSTELYLGLIHHHDGESGARRRITTARSVINTFGVATECGLGRRSPDQVSELLRLHRVLAAPIAPDADPTIAPQH